MTQNSVEIGVSDPFPLVRLSRSPFFSSSPGVRRGRQTSPTRRSSGPPGGPGAESRGLWCRGRELRVTRRMKVLQNLSRLGYVLKFF